MLKNFHCIAGKTGKQTKYVAKTHSKKSYCHVPGNSRGTNILDEGQHKSKGFLHTAQSFILLK